MAESVATLIARVAEGHHRCLNISHRNLTVLPADDLIKVQRVRVLLLNDNNLVLPPNEIMHLSDCLEELVLDGNKFTLLPRKLGEFCHLRKLSLCRTPIGTMTPEIMQLRELSELWLSECCIVSLPKEIGFLTNLTLLGLRKNSLHDIPDEIANLKALKWISLADNHLESLPQKFHLLTNLKHVDLSFNKFRSIPSSLLGAENLKVLLLSHNCIEAVSDDALLSMAQMVKVDLRCNVMKSKPLHWKGLEYILVGEITPLTLPI